MAIYEIKARENDGHGHISVVVLRRIFTDRETANMVKRAVENGIIARWPYEWKEHYAPAKRDNTIPAVWIITKHL